MILSGKSIRWAVENGLIGVSPTPVEEQFQPASLDLRLGGKLHDTVTGEKFTGSTMIQPNRAYIGHTTDEVDLPDNIAAMMTGRSSVGRSGLIVHKTAGWIDPGFTGELTLEIYNFANEPVELKPGQRVAQLVFFPTDRRTRGYDGQYQGQTGITKHGDRE